jgi:hypothetical protein
MPTNQELVDAFDRNWMGHDPEAMDKVMHPDFKQFGAWVMEGREAQKKLQRIVNDTYPEEKWTSETIFDEGNVLTRVRRGDMAFKKGFGPLPPSDEAFPVTAVETYVQNDGLWVISWSALDLPPEMVQTVLPDMIDRGIATYG